jgi:hypothetical protein
MTDHDAKIKYLSHFTFQPGSENVKVIIRSENDTNYPYCVENDTDYPYCVDGPRISSWFPSQFGGHYDGGIDFVLRHECISLIPSEDGWDITQFNDTIENSKEHEGEVVGVYRIGRVPYKNIITMNSLGDAYFNEPHVLCRFSETDGSPYSTIFFREVSGYREFFEKDHIHTEN